MSHSATNWASLRRGISPSAKVVLWQLADRFNPDNGCFPSQVLLAKDCEMSRSSLNNQIAALENAALISRERRRDPKTNRQLATRYRFAFEVDFAPAERAKTTSENTSIGSPNEPEKPAEPSPDIGLGNSQNTAEKPSPNIGHGNDQKPSPISCKSRVQNLDSNPVREPVSNPPKPPMGAEGEDSGFEDFKTKFGMPQADWAKACRKWEKLKPAEQRLFIGAAGTYRKRCEATTESQITPAVFLGREGFAKEICANAVVVLDHWSRGWWALVFSKINRGENIAFSWQQACRRGGSRSLTVKADEAPNAEAREALVPMLRASDTGIAWAKWLASRKLDLPDFDADWRLWMPSQWPNTHPKTGGDDTGHDDGDGDGYEPADDRRYG